MKKGWTHTKSNVVETPPLTRLELISPITILLCAKFYFSESQVNFSVILSAVVLTQLLLLY